MAELLLDRGADPNKAKTGTGATALIVAAYRGHLDVAQHLVVYGANVAAKKTNRWQRNARSTAERKGHGAIVAWLDTVEGWPTFRIAVSSVTPFEPAAIKALLRRGVVDPDDCAGSLAAVRAAATASESAAMKTLVRLAVGGWSQHSHWLHTEGVRVAVVTTLTVVVHLDPDTPPVPVAAAAVATAAAVAVEVSDGPRGVRTPLPELPPEMWQEILRFLARRDWPTRGGPAEVRIV